MEVKHAWLTAHLTLKYTSAPIEEDLHKHLTIIAGDDIMAKVKEAIVYHLRADRREATYVGFKINSLAVDSIRDPVTCQGCLADLGNQEAHSCVGY